MQHLTSNNKIFENWCMYINLSILANVIHELKELYNCGSVFMQESTQNNTKIMINKLGILK